jgi:hypothetical protein
MERNVFSDSDTSTLFGPRPVRFWKQRFPILEDDAVAAMDLESIREIINNPANHVHGGAILAIPVAESSEHPPSASDQLQILPHVIDDLVNGCVAGGAWFPAKSTQHPQGTFAQDAIVCPLCLSKLSEDFKCQPCDWQATTQCGVDAFAYRQAEENLRIAASRVGIEGPRLAALLELNKLFDSLPRPKAQWSQEEIRAGEWELSAIDRQDDCWLSASSDDPHLLSPSLCLPLNEISHIRIDLDTLSSEFVEIYYLVDRQFQLEYEIRSTHEIGASGNHQLIVQIPEAVRARGEHLVRFRIDPSIRPKSRFRVKRVAIE